MRNFRNLLLVRVRSIFLSLGWQHQNAFSCPHSSKVVRKSFGNCIPITYVPFRNGPDKSRQVLLRQAAENPEVVKDVSTSVVKDVSTSFVKTRWPWQNIENLGGSATNIVGGCAALFAAFSYFSTLGHNVADLKSELADLKSDSKQSNARLDANNARYDARFDSYNARFDKVYLGTVSLALGVPALLMIGSGVLKKKGK